MEQRIQDFIREQHIATICCINQAHHPYCFNCMYVFNEVKGLLYFKSGSGTHHAKLIKENPMLSGTVLPDQINLLAVKGIQFSGHLLSGDEDINKEAYRIYHKRLPLAFVRPGEIFVVAIDAIKMMDSHHGIAKKYIWQRAEQMNLSPGNVNN